MSDFPISSHDYEGLTIGEVAAQLQLSEADVFGLALQQKIRLSVYLPDTVTECWDWEQMAPDNDGGATADEAATTKNPPKSSTGKPLITELPHLARSWEHYEEQILETPRILYRPRDASLPVSGTW